MNENAYKVFLQRQRSNKEINEIAALGRIAASGAKLAARGAARGGKSVGGKAKSGYGKLGAALAKGKPQLNPKAVVGKSVGRLPGAAKMSASDMAPVAGKSAVKRVTKDPSKLMGRFGVDPAKIHGKGPKGTPAGEAGAAPLEKMKTAAGQLRRDRLATRDKLAAQKDKPSLLGKIAKGAGQLRKKVDTPQNRELAGKAVKGIAAFAKKGGFSSGFNQLYKDDVPTGYAQAGGQLGGGLNRVLGVGTKAGDEADIDRKQAERAAAANPQGGPAGPQGGPAAQPRRDPFRGLTPTERRNAMMRGMAG